MADATYNLNGGFKPTTKRFADLSGPDFFPTPPWATYALSKTKRSTVRFGSALVATVPCRAFWQKPANPSAVLISTTEVMARQDTFYPSGVEPKGSGTTAYAWFVW